MAQETIFLEQHKFDGGLNMLDPGANQYRDALNIIIRDGQPTTRPGVRRYLPADGGWLAGFWFNQDNARHNDATHTGFWFDFDFVRSPWGEVQGCELIKLSIHDENKIIFASGGFVYIYERGYVTEVPTTPAIGDDETLNFVQANDQVFMFRSGGNEPLYWDGTDDGFVVVPDAVVGDNIPAADMGWYAGGRLWVRVNDDVYASAIYDFTEWDLVGRYWSVERGKGATGVTLFPFHQDIMLAFKNESVTAIMGINAIIMTGTDLADYVEMQVVDNKTGAVSSNAIISVGEDVWYLGYGGIYSFARNQQNRLEKDPIPVSAPIQPLIDRIYWPAADVACAATYDNYVLFAVPVDGSTVNNMILVYDRLANQQKGAWVSPWTGACLNPIRFFQDEHNLIFLSQDNAVRKMFTSDAWDSETPYQDTPQYDATTLYRGGELVAYAYNGDKLWRCLATVQGTAPPDTDYWEEVADQQGAYGIESMIETRQFGLEESTGLRFGPVEIVFRHRNPQITLEQTSRDKGAEKTIYEDLEWSRLEYDTADTPDWDPTNVNGDFAEPYRKDYTLLIGSDGMIVGRDGVSAGTWRTRNLKYLPLSLSNRSIGFRITNTKGHFKLISVIAAVWARRFAGMNVA